MTGQASHGVAPTPEISAADSLGVFAPVAPTPPAAPTPPPPGAPDPTQGGRTLPIGGADGGQADIYKPEGLDQSLIGQTDRETIDKIVNRMTGLRTELAKKGQDAPAIPEKPDGYQWNWSDGVKAAGGIATDDKAVAAFAQIAHEHGFTQQQIDAVPKFFDKMIEAGVIEKPLDPNKLLEDLAPPTFRGSADDKRQKGAERLGVVENWVKALPEAAGFDAQMKDELRLLTMSPAGVRILERMMNGAAAQTFAVQPGNQPQPVTQRTLDARISDPRNDAMGPKFDPAFAEETREMFKKLYPSS